MGRVSHVRALIVTPAPAGSRGGNRVTALRWAKRLRELGSTVRVVDAWRGEPCDLAIALHARKSHPSIVQLAPRLPTIVALTGTDVYGAAGIAEPAVADSLARAARIVVLQARALDVLPAELRAKARTIVQSAVAAAPTSHGAGFVACAISHLRDVKDPLLAARAIALVPDALAARVVHFGAAPDEPWHARARAAEIASGGRWRWLGERPRQDVLAALAGASALVLTSVAEGGANVVTEAIAAGVPVLSTDIAGSVGLLGADYPGYFPVGDAGALAALIARCARDPATLAELRERVGRLAPLVAPARERASWAALVGELMLG